MMAEMVKGKVFGMNGNSRRPTWNLKSGTRNSEPETQNSKLKTQNSKLGFTIVELLVVIAIIAILAGAITMGVHGMFSKQVELSGWGICST